MAPTVVERCAVVSGVGADELAAKRSLDGRGAVAASDSPTVPVACLSPSLRARPPTLRRELQEEVANVPDEPTLQVALLRIGAESQEVEDVRVLEGLLREVGPRWRERGLEVRERLAGASVQAGHNLGEEHVAQPHALDGLTIVPLPRGLLLYAVQQGAAVEPGQSCSNLLHRFGLGPGGCERAHVLQVARREALHLGERRAGRC
jgi:hypothetical protein